MYTINYVSNIVKLNKRRKLFYKILKIFNILVQLLIVFLIWQSFNFYAKINQYNKNIEKVKHVIEEKRDKNNMDRIEKLWNSYYFKLLAVKQQLSARTNYGLMLKSFAEALPADDNVATIVVDGRTLEMTLGLKESKVKELGEDIYSYVDVLKMAFDKKDFFNDDIEFLTVVNYKVNDTAVDLMKIKMGVITKK